MALRFAQSSRNRYHRHHHDVCLTSSPLVNEQSFSQRIAWRSSSRTARFSHSSLAATHLTTLPRTRPRVVGAFVVHKSENCITLDPLSRSLVVQSTCRVPRPATAVTARLSTPSSGRCIVNGVQFVAILSPASVRRFATRMEAVAADVFPFLLHGLYQHADQQFGAVAGDDLRRWRRRSDPISQCLCRAASLRRLHGVLRLCRTSFLKRSAIQFCHRLLCCDALGIRLLPLSPSRRASFAPSCGISHGGKVTLLVECARGHTFRYCRVDWRAALE